MLNLLSIVVTNPLVERLALVSLELMVLCVLVWCVVRVVRPRSPRLIALLWLIVLVKAVVGFGIGAQWPMFDLKIDYRQLTPLPTLDEQTSRIETRLQWTVPATPAPAATPSTIAAPAARPAFEPASLVHQLQQTRRYVILTTSLVAEVLVGIWLVGATVLLLLTARDILLIRRICRDARAPEPPLAAALGREARRLGIGRPPRLLVSEAITTPALVGWLRTVILMPDWIVDEMPPERIRWLLGHELVHWKHMDPLGLLVRRAAQVLFWFHPAVWLAGRFWEESMERACDRALIGDMEQARAYAKELYTILSRLTQRPGFHAFGTGLFVTRTQVGRRIELLLSDPMRVPARLGAASLTTLGAMSVLTLPAGIVLTESHAPDIAPFADMGELAAPVVAAPVPETFVGEVLPSPTIAIGGPEWDGWLKIDFGDPNQGVPDGWVGWSPFYVNSTNVHTDQTFSTPFDDEFTIGLSRDVMWRKHLRVSLPRDTERLLRDGLRSFGEIRFTFQGLDEGDYALVPVSCNLEDEDAPPVTFDIMVNGTPVREAVPAAYRHNVDAAFVPGVVFTVSPAAAGAGLPVHIGFLPQGGPLWINGLMLRKVGEPFGNVVSAISVSTGKPYSLATAAVGAMPYIDRSYTIVSLPEALEHQILLQTANDDKWIESRDFVLLEVDRPVTVYLCYAASAERRPDWARDFAPTGETLVTTDRVYEVFRKRFDAGRIALGGNKYPDIEAPSQYIVVLSPER